MSQTTRINLFRFAVTALCLLVLSSLAVLINSTTHAAEDFKSFDHFTTGFPLLGKHEFLDCSACHIGGQFKGTPMECVLCHNNSRAPGKHAEHIPSSNRCDDCHTEQSWKGARYDHSDVVEPCTNCHNNIVALGKTPSHILSTEQCEDCHNTITFARVGRVDHIAVLGSCSSCHNNVVAIGKHPGHIQTTSECDLCHNTTTWLSAGFDHSNVTQPCESCHNGITSTGKHPGHIQTTFDCDYCHNTSSWLNARFDHAAVTQACSACHTNVTATGKPATHITTTAECNSCHFTSGWQNIAFDHSAVTGLCLSCHNGTISTGKSTTHFVTTEDCDRCHSTTVWIPLILFRHNSPDYPGDHRTTVLCVDCHRTNNQVIAWPFPAYQPDCAGCHADDYLPASHDNQSVTLLRDCAGSCHVGGVNISNQHRTSAAGW